MQELRNGQIYKSETLYAYRAVLQWVDSDNWMLLSEPELGAHNTNVMVAISDPITRKLVLTGGEMRARLEAHKWRVDNDHCIKIVLRG